MTRGNNFTYALGGALILLCLVVSALCYQHVQLTREWAQLERQLTAVNKNKTIMNSLAREAVEYSRRNPAINPILQSAGLPVAAPAAKGK
ncbi:MAG: hypothetical protein AB1705_09860 [Verrucomicrobiota bacterium]